MTTDHGPTTTGHYSHGFINSRDEPFLISAITSERHHQVVDLYLSHEHRGALGGLGPAGEDDCVRWVEGLIARGTSLGALSFEHGLVGHGAIIPADSRTCDMLTLVCPSHRGTGIGAGLTRCLIQQAHGLGLEEIRLRIVPDNHVARHVYEKCGFECVGLGPAGELEMSLDLLQYRQAMAAAVRDVMNRQLIVLHPDMPCKVALMIFLEDKVDALPVVADNNELVGILTEADLMVEENIDRKVGNVQTRNVVAVQENSTIAEVVFLLRYRNLRCIPVLNRRNELVGVVRRKDLLAYYVKRYGQRSGAREATDQ